jgi:hypothetical protein
MKVVMDAARGNHSSPLAETHANTSSRRSAERKSETTFDNDNKWFAYTGGKRCPSPSNNSLLGILRPEVPKPAPSFKLRAPFATSE